jgi:hypothetical protein
MTPIHVDVVDLILSLPQSLLKPFVVEHLLLKLMLNHQALLLVLLVHLLDPADALVFKIELGG